MLKNLTSIQRQHTQHFHKVGLLRAPNNWFWGNYSMTKKLSTYFKHPIRVSVIFSKNRYPTVLECQLLGIKYTQYVLERCVGIYSHHNEQLLIAAITVIPLHALKGSGKQFKYLKDKSIGKILFKRLSDITTLRWVNYQQQLPLQADFLKKNGLKNVSTTRNSLYYWKNKPLIVSEYFISSSIF